MVFKIIDGHSMVYYNLHFLHHYHLTMNVIRVFSIMLVFIFVAALMRLEYLLSLYLLGLQYRLPFESRHRLMKSKLVYDIKV